MTFAIYYELEDSDGAITQSLFIPGFKTEYSPARFSVGATYFHRSLTSGQPRRRWASVHVASDIGVPSGPGDPSVVVPEVIEQLSGISSYMRQSLASVQRLVAAFPIIVNDSDTLALVEDTTRVPSGLQARINEKRLQEGLPALPGR